VSLLAARRRLLLADEPETPPPPSGDALIVHTLDFETGNLSQIAGVTASGGMEWGVQQTRVHRGNYAAYLRLINSSSGDAIRFRVDNNLAGAQSDLFGGYGWNLPRDAYYSMWYYIPQYIDMGGDDPWNIMQFKQNIDYSGANGMKLLENICFRDRGAGNPYGMTVKRIIHDDGHWSHTNKPTTIYNLPLFSVGQWHHIEWRRLWSTNPNIGKSQIWVDEQLIHDWTGYTYLDSSVDQTWDWDDFNPARHFQCTFNSYHTGGTGVNHDPNTHTLYIDSGYVAMGGRVGMAGP
jgi:hypothetical protein